MLELQADVVVLIYIDNIYKKMQQVFYEHFGKYNLCINIEETQLSAVAASPIVYHRFARSDTPFCGRE